MSTLRECPYSAKSLYRCRSPRKGVFEVLPSIGIEKFLVAPGSLPS